MSAPRKRLQLSPGHDVAGDVKAEIAIRCAALQAAASIVGGQVPIEASWADIMEKTRGIALEFEVHLRGGK